MSFTTLVTCFLALGTTGWAQYVLEDDYLSGGSFFDKFSFFDAPDPTHGFVSYQGQSDATKQHLVNSTSGNVRLGVDTTNNAPNGRNSVRLTSNKAYSSGLFILDADHMPFGCGTWPAFWLVGPNWPAGGEIDIIEGVNEQSTNDMTLHTSDGCSITNNNAFSGTLQTDNCYIDAAGQGNNQGCQITTTNTQTYGAGFNANKGGVYATEWTSSAISIYFFPRGAIPSDITSGSPNPSSWGKPLAQFQGGCDIPSFFSDQQVVFDTTFCGDWAGSVWSSGSCAAKADTCNDYVANNPSDFVEAYWSINALQVYQAGSGVSPSYSSAAPSSTPSSVSSSSVVPSSISATSQSGLPTSASSVWTSSLIPTVAPTTFATSSVPSPASSFTRPDGPGHGPIHTKYATGNDSSSPFASGSGTGALSGMYPSATGLVGTAPVVAPSNVSVAAATASPPSISDPSSPSSVSVAAASASFEAAALPISGTSFATASATTSVAVPADPKTSAIFPSATSDVEGGPDYSGWQGHSWRYHHHRPASTLAAGQRHIQRHARRHGAGVL
ncbi:hypothetical protein LTR78_004300 [Recurvomyces mirabilis]|uniref:endo-1,3(4)-beta-glucanase n=1 Tax=Recurvomyces mirabilis TaxID=574656 RepID=A0AAE0WPV8_9PEZI|nr:hypothetical protein LTR78_004300 [Recurvomyces mirabilis]KAK5156033.1 hypothetical protein LTS14_005599 [Recurvomyces mirabilis]